MNNNLNAAVFLGRSQACERGPIPDRWLWIAESGAWWPKLWSALCSEKTVQRLPKRLAGSTSSSNPLSVDGSAKHASRRDVWNASCCSASQHDGSRKPTLNGWTTVSDESYVCLIAIYECSIPVTAAVIDAIDANQFWGFGYYQAISVISSM